LGGIQHGTVLGGSGDRHSGVSVNDRQGLNKPESHEKLQITPKNAEILLNRFACQGITLPV
jgi:hypothetical protein